MTASQPPLASTLVNNLWGVEWCEDQLLARSTTWRRSRYTPMTLILQKLFADIEH